MRFEQLFEVIMNDDYTDEDTEMFSAIDKVGEVYGSMISYIVGFDKRFNG
jgi:hypothetical protein